MNDDEWLKEWIPRLCRTAKSGDTFSVYAVLEEGRQRPGCLGYVTTATYMLESFRDEMNEARTVKAMGDRVAAMKAAPVNVIVGRDLIVHPGGVAGVDASTAKLITGASDA